jgi:hypothetical protein
VRSRRRLHTATHFYGAVHITGHSPFQHAHASATSLNQSQHCNRHVERCHTILRAAHRTRIATLLPSSSAAAACKERHGAELHHPSYKKRRRNAVLSAKTITLHLPMVDLPALFHARSFLFR